MSRAQGLQPAARRGSMEEGADENARVFQGIRRVMMIPTATVHDHWHFWGCSDVHQSPMFSMSWVWKSPRMTWVLPQRGPPSRCVFSAHWVVQARWEGDCWILLKQSWCWVVLIVHGITACMVQWWGALPMFSWCLWRSTMKNSPGDSPWFLVTLVIQSQLFPKGGTNRVLYAETGVCWPTTCCCFIWKLKDTGYSQWSWL